jgi:hypothetical protein
MGARELQGAYDRLNPKTLASVGKLLGRSGEPFDRMLSGWLLETREIVADVPEFAVWMAEALVWARFAERANEFFAAAAGFITNGDPELLDEAVQFPDRFGADRLRDALAAFGRWFDTMREPLTQLSPNPVRWKANQERSLRVAERLKADGEFRGIGLWLFPAPFKIMAVAHHETWVDAALESVVMPTGTQVERALWKLHGDGVIRIDKKILAGSDGTFADEYTNLWAYQLPQHQLAAAGGSTVPHINGALHELGDRGPGR